MLFAENKSSVNFNYSLNNVDLLAILIVRTTFKDKITISFNRTVEL